MKIAQVSPYDYSYAGGVQEHIRHLDRHLRARGHEVWILVASSADEDEFQDNIIKVSGAVWPVPYSGSIARITLSPRVYRRVKGILRTMAFDIVHIHEPIVPLLPLAVLRHSKAVNVGTFHAYRDSHAAYELAKPLLEPFFNRLDGKIAVSPAARDAVAHYFPGDYVIIPNGIEFERFASPRVEPLPHLMDGKLNVLFVGRLEKRKGFRHLLSAFRYVKAAVPNARLIVVGDYSRAEKAPFVYYAREEHIRDVKFVGYAESAEIPRYYRSAHVFCAPSTGFESFGIVLLEAMAAGVPIVASDIPGYRTVLTDGAEGFLVPPGDEPALAGAIIRLLQNAELRARLGAHGQQTAKCYDWARITGQIEAYYNELLERRRIERQVGADPAERSLRELVARVSGWFDPR